MYVLTLHSFTIVKRWRKGMSLLMFAGVNLQFNRIQRTSHHLALSIYLSIYPNQGDPSHKFKSQFVAHNFYCIWSFINLLLSIYTILLRPIHVIKWNNTQNSQKKNWTFFSRYVYFAYEKLWRQIKCSPHLFRCVSALKWCVAPSYCSINNIFNGFKLQICVWRTCHA